MKTATTLTALCTPGPRLGRGTRGCVTRAPSSVHTAAVGSPDYSAALDLVPDVLPRQLGALLDTVAAPIGATELAVYLADFQGVALQAVPLAPGSVLPDDEDVASSMPGRVYRTGELLAAERDGATRVWAPLIERGERTGVLALTVPAASPEILADCARIGRFAGLLVRSFARSTDMMHLRRRRRPMSLAAGMQWDLLPPLTIRSARALACGRLEPAYEIAGDAFDYVFNDAFLHAAIFDGMGHGVASTLMTTLAVGAYRHARRSGESLGETHAWVDRAVAEQYHGDGFVTGAVSRLDLRTGVLEWTNAGHPAPLLLRSHRVVKELACAPSLPWGLGGGCEAEGIEALEPGDCVLVFTDGVVEGRSHDGEEYGVDRLAGAWERQAASSAAPDEVLRRLVEAVMSYNAGKLRDDASLMLLSWDGPFDAAGPTLRRDS